LLAAYGRIQYLARNSKRYGDTYVNIQVTSSAGATLRRTRLLTRALGQRGRQKYNCVFVKVTNTTR